nr:MAG TPA: hypothetical protein [Caudoviricetes sp.]
MIRGLNVHSTIPVTSAIKFIVVQRFTGHTCGRS